LLHSKRLSEEYCEAVLPDALMLVRVCGP